MLTIASFHCIRSLNCLLALMSKSNLAIQNRPVTFLFYVLSSLLVTIYIIVPYFIDMEQKLYSHDHNLIFYV